MAERQEKQEDQKFRASLVYRVHSCLKTKTKPEVQYGKVMQFITSHYHGSDDVSVLFGRYNTDPRACKPKSQKEAEHRWVKACAQEERASQN